jgi:superfamily I DNA and/or RNA helicase
VVDEVPGNLYDDLVAGQDMRFAPLPPLENDPKDEGTREFQLAYSEAKLTDETYQIFIENLDHNATDHAEEVFRAERELKDRVREALGMSPRQTKADLSLSQHALNNGISPSYELPLPDNEHEDGRHNDKDIQTLLLPDALETRMGSLMTKCRTWVQETGINVLYVAFGFLEWTETGTSKISYSPLVLLPVELERRKTRDGLEYSIRSIGDAAETNSVLAEKLRLDFGIEIPQMNGSTIEDYFVEIAEISPNNLGWKIRRQVALGAFPSARMAMYYDLETAAGKFDMHNVIRELFGGTPVLVGESPFGEEYEVDSPDVEKKVPFLVSDADSSQFSTIVDVVDGKNLAVEGPPGSGKSQTIVNTIAAALANGQKVLFVAEKMAALDVVKSRLEAVGLGEFILSLQASKSTKEQVISSLRDRMEIEVSGTDTGYDKKASDFRKARDEISEYVEVISSHYKETGKTVFEILGKSISTNKLLRSLPRQLQAAPLRNVEGFTPATFEEIREICDQVENSWKEVGASSEYWKGTRIKNLNPFNTDEILDGARYASELYGKLEDVNESLCGYGISVDCKTEQLNLVKAAVDKNQEIVSKIDWQLLTKVLDSDCFALAKAFFGRCDEAQATIQVLEEDVIEPLDPSRSQQLRMLAIKAEQISLPGLSPNQIGMLREQNKSNKETYEKVCGVITPIAPVYSQCKGWKIGSTLKACNIVSGISHETLSLRDQKLADPAFKAILNQGAGRIRVLRERRDELEQEFSLDGLPSYSEIMDHASVIESAGAFSFLSSGFKHSKRFYQSKAKGLAFDKSKASSGLSKLAAWVKDKEELERDPQLIALLGVRFNGLESDFSGIANVLSFYHRVDNELAGIENIDLRNFLKFSDVDLVTTLRNGRVEGQTYAHLDCSYGEALEILEHIRQQEPVFEETVREIEALAPFLKNRSRANIDWLRQCAEDLERIQATVGALSNDDDAKNILGDHFRGHNTDRRTTSLEMGIAEQVSQLQPENRELVLRSFERGNHTDLKRAIEKRFDLEQKSHGALLSLSDSSKMEIGSFYKETNRDTALFLENASRDRKGLHAYSKLHTSIEDLKEKGYGVVVDSLLPTDEGLSRIGAAMEAVMARSLTKAVYSTYGNVLANYDGSRLNDLRKRIAKIDKELIRLSKDRLRSKIHSSSHPPAGVGSGRKSTWTELSLIYNEINKSRRYVPVRDLTRRAGQALLELKPCWMMSPLAVAQYIQQGALEFDLVIIDEASQMTPENAVGAILRSRKAMVVGDTNQLPPSNFFSKVFEDEDADEDETVTDESILEMANSAFRPARRLRWHYRSRHSGLIAFSNHHIYNDDLVVFPSATEAEQEHMGVKLVPVNGKYSSGTNVDEAKVMVDHIVKFMKESKDRSLGVVTLNQKQRDLILEEMNFAIKDNNHVARYVDKWEEENDGLESFFVKNLENVQGDERDVIFIGTVYGPAKVDGPVMQRFGPINGVAGKRRLNVLFSRAKQQIVTFSSMKGTDIVAEEDGNPGAYMLKQWLEYSRTGVLHAGTRTEREPDSDFEVHVIEQLKSLGCIPVPQVGVAGYFIDIGVKHPDWPHGFILGVECDGAAYHSSKSARDRDRLRQEVLEGLGWHFHRIWSTDWFSNPQGEVEKLRKVVETRLADLKAKEKEFIKAPVVEDEVDEAMDLDIEAKAPANRKPIMIGPKVQVEKNALGKNSDPIDRTLFDNLADKGRGPIALDEKAELVKPISPINTPEPRSSSNVDGAKVGDRILVRYLEGPHNELKITLSDTENVPSRKIVHIDEPLGEAVYGALEGEEIEVWIGGNVRKAIVVQILSKAAP